MNLQHETNGEGNCAENNVVFQDGFDGESNAPSIPNSPIDTLKTSIPYTPGFDPYDSFVKHDFKAFAAIAGPKLKHTVIISIDSEYQSGSERAGQKNHVLSFQAVLLNPVTGHTVGYLMDCEGGKRPTLGMLLAEILARGDAEGVVPRFVEKIILCAHYSLAELTSFTNFDVLRKRFDGIRKTFASVQGAATLTIRRGGKMLKVDVSLVDTSLLVPGGGSLEKVGKIVGLEKIELPEGAKERMREFKKHNPELFWRYACRDVDVTLLYLTKVSTLIFEMTGEWSIPLTLGSVAPKLLRKIWKDQGFDHREVLGLQTTKIERHKCGRVRTITIEIDHPKKRELKALAEISYQGARNEAFFFGPSPLGNFTDYDLTSAYITAMACIGMPNWNALRLVTKLDEFTLDVIGCAKVDFHFPQTVRFPSLAVREENSLIFPSNGRCWATAPDIVLARNLGADLQLVSDNTTALRGFILPMNCERRPFATAGEYIQDMRNTAKSLLLEKLYKEVGNSIYGKLAQAVHSRNVLETRSGLMVPLAESKITNAYFAMHTTGLVRAVISEILNGLPRSTRVISTTTDGFLCDASNSEASAACSGAICTLFSEARTRMKQNSGILEVKHRADQVLCFRTRGQATLRQTLDDNKLGSGMAPLLAKGGIKTKANKVEEANEEIIRMFFTRENGQKYPTVRLRGFSEIYNAAGRADLNLVESLKAYSMDFDWKRKPKTTGERSVEGHPQAHLWFDTTPLDSPSEFKDLRARAKGFKQAGGTLKTLADLARFNDYVAVASPHVHRSSKGGNALRTIKTAFLRAYTKRAWNIERKLGNKQIADLLTRLGYSTSIEEVENSLRPKMKLLPNSVHETPEVLAFITAMNPHFPDFPWSLILV